MKEPTVYISQQGKCPKCHSYNINYAGSQLVNNFINYDFKCNNCGFKGKEWYELDFDGHTDTKGNKV